MLDQTLFSKGNRPQKPEAATAEFSVGQVVYITSGPSAGRALHIAKQEGR